MRGFSSAPPWPAVVGAVDDFRGLAPFPKLGGQVVAAADPCAFGVWIDHFTFRSWARSIFSRVGVPLTVIWIVAVMNMVNFLDGMDGLASGVCAISGVTFSVLALSLGKADAAILSAIVAGACIGFLRHNFFPARIFMGDSGALVLGYTLATVSVAGLLKTASTVVLFLPLLVLAVPIVDTSFVVAKRLKHGRPVYSADRWHLHHRFVNIGCSQRRAALTMWAWCATLGLAALATRFVPFREGGVWHPWETVAVVLLALAALAFSVYIVYLLEIVKLMNPRIRRRDAEQERADDRVTTLPQGTVTFVFTDIEGSTTLLKELGDRYADALADHRRLIREEFVARRPGDRHAGRRVLLLLRPRARRRCRRGRGPTRRSPRRWPDGSELRVRMSLHTGEPVLGEEGYVGIDTAPRGSALRARRPSLALRDDRRAGVERSADGVGEVELGAPRRHRHPRAGVPADDRWLAE